jgi:hypothetical protein
MPNHCNNTLGITGPKEDVEQFIELVTYKGLDKDKDQYELFKNLLPMPEELIGTTAPSKEKNEQLIEKYGSDNWYDWCNENWGTKWGDYSLTFDGVNYEVINEYSTLENGEKDYETSIPKITGNASAHFHYDTAWAPGCEELANAICNRFPNLKGFISYEEPGMAFAGQLLFRDGDIMSHDSWDYNQKYDDVNDIDFDYLGGRYV